MMLRTTSVLALGLFVGLASVHAQTQSDSEATTTQQQTDQQQTAGGSVGLNEDSMMVDEMIGSDVYSQDGQESIGSINDVLISVEGEAEGLVVGVGGWLGVGERDVMISFDQLSLERQEDEFRLVSQMSREELEGQPEFERVDMREQRETTAMQQPGTAGQQPGTMVETDTEQRETTATRRLDTQQGETVAEMEAADEETAQAEQDTQQQEVQQQDGKRGRVVFQDEDSILASTMLGASVRSQADEDMGEINDVIIGMAGNVQGYVVGVGGFLGIGEKDVILSPDRIDIARQDGEDVRITALETRQDLETAPAYERSGSGQQETMQQDTQTQD